MKAAAATVVERGPYVLFAGDEAWQVRSPAGVDDLRLEPKASAGAIASQVAEALRGRGYQGQGVLLALPSAWCLSAVLAVGDLPRQDRAAMAFRLEEKLPLAAENFTADFVLTADGDRALGVCASNEPLVSLVQALESAGVAVQSVTPAAVLALQSAIEDEEGDALVVWGEGDGVNVFSVDGGRPVAWALVPAEAHAVGLQMDVAAMELSGPRLLAYDVAAELAEQLGGPVDVVGRTAIDDVVASRAGDVLTGALVPWVEFRRGALAIDDPLRVVRRPLNAALAAAAVLCVVLAGVFLFRGWRYDGLARRYEAELAEEFRREFPGWAVPANVRRVVESERTKVVGAGTSAVPAEARESALKVLHDVLAALPADTGMSIEQLAVNDTSLQIDGRSRSSADADVLAAAARAAGMDVSPPQTQRLPDGGWSFVVRGSKAARAPAAAASMGGN